MSKTLDVLVPDLGAFHDVPVVEVRVRPGAPIKRDDPVVVLESDKAAMDVPSPADGIVRSVHVKAGDKVSTGSMLIELEIQEEKEKTTPAEEPRASPPPPAMPVPSPPTMPVRQAVPHTSLPIVSGVIPAERPEPEIPKEGFRPSPTEKIPLVLDLSTPRHHASPAVRRLAREMGVDLARVRGTGRNGRIVEADLRRYVKEVLTHPSPPERAASRVPDTTGIDFSQYGPIQSQPLNRVRRATAAHMHRSWSQIPHVTQYEEADITDLEAFRRNEADEARRRGVRLTLLAFIVKAAVAALKQHSTFNASLDPSGENLIIKRYFHIGIAVDTQEGLLVPVIRDADRKGLWELAADLESVSRRAREGKLTLDEAQGASFTISSLGGIGGTGFSPIINAPEVAILGVSRASLRPVYHENQLQPRLILPFSLSYDHRANDGAQAARFVAHLRTLLSDIRQMLL